MTVNAFCSRKGWLFDDLRDHLEDAGAVGSDEPLPDADAWICIRTKELEKSPDLSRTVVQFHSLVWTHHFDWSLIDQCGGIVATHPDQLDMARDSGVNLKGKLILCRPIGSLRCFTLRESMPEHYTVGWVGRPIKWKDRDIKRLDLFVEAVKLAAEEVDLRVLLVGERLGPAAARIKRAGIPVEVHQRTETPIESYPALYHSMDALVSTAEQEPGPLSIYEALACGVPVISTPRSWRWWSMPMVVAEAEPEALARKLVEVEGHRDAFFKARAALRESQSSRLEDWAEISVEMAERLAKRATN